MIQQADTLPNDIDALKDLVVSTQQLLVEKDNTIAVLEEKLRLALMKHFAASSEKISVDQLNLFNEAEQTVSETDVPTDEAVDVTIPEHKRKKRGRKPLPDHLPRLRIEHDIAEEQKVCGCGCLKKKIGEEISEQLDIIPAKIQVLQHVRFKYACRSCEGVEDDGPTVVIALMPKQPIPKSNASPGLLAHITTAKLVDGTPLYRQEGQFARIGIRLGRNTKSGWMIKLGGDLVVPLFDLMEEAQLSYDLLQMDETTVQVLKETGRKAQSKSYMWVRRGGPPLRPVILFDYDPSRSGAVPTEYCPGDDMSKLDKPTVSAKHLAYARKRAAKMDIKEKEKVCDILFATQPNLLDSILVQKSFGASMEKIDVLLNMLIVMHLAVEKSGQVLAMVSEEEQERELERQVATINFSEDLDGELFAQFAKQYSPFKKEKFLFAYVIKTMLSEGFNDDPSENAKFPLLAGVNLVACIANAKRI